MSASPELVHTGTAVTQAHFERPGSALARIIEQAPYIARCSDNKTAALTRPRCLASRFPYMTVNRPDLQSWLVFDVDRPLGDRTWDDAGLPPPNLVVVNPGNGHAHLFYAISPVATGVKARPRPIQLMQATYKAMAVALDADLAYRGPISKTPGHPKWHTREIHDQEFSLGDLAKYVELPKYRPFGACSSNRMNELDPGDSRHWALFRYLCAFAYPSVRWFRVNAGYAQFHDDLLQKAIERNQRGWRSVNSQGVLSRAEVRSTVKSVSRWTWDNYNGSARCRLGVMALDATLPLSERQRLAAERTHQERRQATERRIEAVVRNLCATGERVTFTGIARSTGLTRHTVAKYRDLIDRVVSSVQKLSESAPAHSPASHCVGVTGSVETSIVTETEHGNFGVHKITNGKAIAVRSRSSSEVTVLEGGQEVIESDMSSRTGGGVEPTQCRAWSAYEVDSRVSDNTECMGASSDARFGRSVFEPLPAGGLLDRSIGLSRDLDQLVKSSPKLQGIGNVIQRETLPANTVYPNRPIIQDAPENTLVEVLPFDNSAADLTGISPDQTRFPDDPLVRDGDFGGEHSDDAGD